MEHDPPPTHSPLLPFSTVASVMDSRVCFIGEDAFTGAGIFNGKCNELGASERSESDDWDKRYSSLSECRCSSTSTTFQKQKICYCKDNMWTYEKRSV